MAKKKKEVIVEPEEEEVTCPVCGKPVGMDVTECPHCGAEFEAEEVEEIPEIRPASKAEPAVTESPPDEEGEMADCPVCGRSVSLSASSCPYCGAEFEAEEVEEIVETESPAPAKPAAKPTVMAPVADEEETAECPVCGKPVGLSVASCPYCGAEFEEEEVEEIIEVEEKPAARAAQPARVSRPEPVVEEESVEVGTEGPEPVLAEGPTSITDFRVIGMALIALGVIGSQISFMISWYWTWVPPIKDNLGMFVGIAAAVIVVGLLVFMLVKRFSKEGRKVPKQTPGVALSLFLFGIMALVLVMLWNPINNALQSSNVGVGVMFVVLFVVGVVMMFLQARSSSAASA
jgi:predicted amidophosphoribosyltransferase